MTSTTSVQTSAPKSETFVVENTKTDMVIQFATCCRKTALGYIQEVYPSKEISDTPESAGKLLDFVEKDIVRIQDPKMYGSQIQVVPASNWDDKHREEIVSACKIFHE